LILSAGLLVESRVNHGGPCQYADGDMSTVHQGREITSAAFDAVMWDLVTTKGLLAPLKTAIVEKK